MVSIMLINFLHADSVQKSLEAKFSGGREGTIPITPSPEFHSRMGVSGLTAYLRRA